MRSMSFMLTTPQVRARRKWVTRRIGWRGLKPGDLLRAVVKCCGLRKGEHQEPLAVIRVLSRRSERLDEITAADCEAEGFPELTPAQFVAMFCEAMVCQPSTLVQRIEFEYVDEEPHYEPPQAVEKGRRPRRTGLPADCTRIGIPA